MSATATGPRIEVLVDKKGQPTTTAFGLQGEACKVASAPFEALFGDVVSSQATSEAYESPNEIEIDIQQGDG